MNRRRVTKNREADILNDFDIELSYVRKGADELDKRIVGMTKLLFAIDGLIKENPLSRDRDEVIKVLNSIQDVIDDEMETYEEIGDYLRNTDNTLSKLRDALLR